MTLEYTGVNISGLEFGRGERLWYDYAMPGKEYYEYWRDVGSTIVRIPFKVGRLQNEPFDDLNTDYLNLIKDSVANAREMGMTAILDMHNYGKYGGGRIDRDGASVEAFSDVWQKLSAEFKGQDDVWLNLMNEPNGFEANHWANITQQVVLDLRDNAVDNKLLLSGTLWSGVQSWISSGNAEAYEGFVDPLDNFAFDVHQYLDEWSTGTNDSYIEDTAAPRAVNITEWAAENGYQLFLGETGVSDDTGQQAELAKLFDYMADNSEVWLGWALWGTGPWWPDDYHFNINPDSFSGDDIPHDLGIEGILDYFALNTPDTDIVMRDPLIDGVADASLVGAEAATLLNGLDAITVSVKVRSNSIGHDKGIFDTEKSDNSDDAFAIRYDKNGANGGGNNVIKAALKTTEGLLVIESESNVQAIGEQTLTLTWESGGDLKLYIDGIEATLSATDGPKGGVITGIEDLLLGSGPKYKAGAWDGSVQDFKVWDYALTPGQVGQNAGIDCVIDTAKQSAPEIYAYEAEDMILTGGDKAYYIETNAHASNGHSVRLGGNQSGEVMTVFENKAGIYSLDIDYFDEKDGYSTYELKINDIVIDSWKANSSYGSASPDAKSFRTKTIEDLELSEGDVITIAGNSHKNEYARLDKLTFTQKNAGATNNDDTIYGDDTDNIFEGLLGNDILYGNGGDDTLVAGFGNDCLIGGDGADRFVFNNDNDNGDIIHDFSKAEGDVIVLSNILQGYDPVSDMITDFVSLVVDEGNGKAVLSVNEMGNADSEFVNLATIFYTGESLDFDSLIDNALIVE